MNKQEATELRETILRELPDGFTCGELVDMSKFECPENFKPEEWNTFWFYVEEDKAPRYCPKIKQISRPEDWELLKRFSLAYAEYGDREDSPVFVGEKPFGAPSQNWIESQADQDFNQRVLRGEEEIKPTYSSLSQKFGNQW